uniref:SH3 domain-containing protein n=1 Tax=Panagrellus redivivus TaxID=6233 RepID=A0A7E4US44_PANRE
MSLSSVSSFDSFYASDSQYSHSYQQPSPVYSHRPTAAVKAMPIMAHEAPQSRGLSGKSRPASFMTHAEASSTVSKAQKLSLKAQKLKLSSLGSELSHSCSALYAMLTEPVSPDGGSSFHSGCDQTDAVAAHSQRGIEFFEKYGHFVKERAAIEEEYASKLRLLAKKNLSLGKKKDDTEQQAFSYVASFCAMLKEIESLANQHEMISDRLRKDIHPFVVNKCGTLRQVRKHHQSELNAMNVNLERTVEAMAKMQRSYMKAFKEAENAYMKNEKNEKNMDLSRADLEKSRNNVTHKNKLCEEAKQGYAAALEQANQAKRDHFEMKLPQLLANMRATDVERINDTQGAMKKTIEAETSVLKIIQACYDEMLRAVDAINPQADMQVVVDQNVSGYACPPPFEFHDLGDPGNCLISDGHDNGATMKRGTLPLSSKNGSNGSAKSIGRRQSMHQKFFGGGNAEKPVKSISNGSAASSGDYATLPPQQRCRKIQGKLEELQKERDRLQNSLMGAEKMLSVYKTNPKLGKASDVEPDLLQYRKQLASMDLEVGRFRTLLEHIQNEMKASSENGGLRSPYHNGGHASPATSSSSPRISSSGVSSAANTNRTSYSEESVSSESSNGFTNRLNSKPLPTPIVVNGSTPVIATPVKESTPPQIPTQQHQQADTTNGTYEDFDLPALGTCVALYAFEGGADGTTVAMREGETLQLLERDEGDGWTRIRNTTSGAEGFVPTSYLNCTWY